MRIRTGSLALLVLLVACTGDEVVVRGSLHGNEAYDDVDVWVVGGPAARPVSPGGSFEVEGLPPGPTDLRFTRSDDEIARIRVGHLPAGARLTLERIRFGEQERAFPSAVRIHGAREVTINGIRVAEPSALPEVVETRGSVLAMNEDADALLLRPRGDTLADLAVAITPTTEWASLEGEDTSPASLDYGDSVHVVGRSDSGYVYAERLIVYPRAAERDEADAERRGRGPIDRLWDWIRGSDGADGGANAPARRSAEDPRARIPKGHEPPPGMCRDWDPSLPPGQQPPPYEC